jgi:hypothetical protein
MAAPVVFEGAVGGKGGTLFKDIKFWVSLRVPMRSTWLEEIKVVDLSPYTLDFNTAHTLWVEQWRQSREGGEECGLSHCRPCEEGGASWLLLLEMD